MPLPGDLVPRRWKARNTFCTAAAPPVWLCVEMLCAVFRTGSKHGDKWGQGSREGREKKAELLSEAGRPS